MNVNRPLTVGEGALCAFSSILLCLLQAEWTGFWHWWAIVAGVWLGITAVATFARRAVGEERLAEWKG